MNTDQILVSRQPIYRADSNLLGYELLFREGNAECATFSDGAAATAQVIVKTFLHHGIEEMVGPHLAFINFGRQLLMDDACELLPEQRLVLEVLETVEPDRQLLKRLADLRAKGYKIALDDFVCDSRYVPLLEFANFVKVDILGTRWEEIQRALGIISKYPIELIAEKVETQAQYDRCCTLGFHHFQGYFFGRPQNF